MGFIKALEELRDDWVRFSMTGVGGAVLLDRTPPAAWTSMRAENVQDLSLIHI